VVNIAVVDVTANSDAELAAESLIALLGASLVGEDLDVVVLGKPGYNAVGDELLPICVRFDVIAVQEADIMPLADNVLEPGEIGG
jgi:hypothetical protein